jgi:nucleoid DNA-binding protein
MQPRVQHLDFDLAVNNIIQSLTDAAVPGERIKIRGFGGFSIIPRKARAGRNPKTGELCHFRYCTQNKPITPQPIQFPNQYDIARPHFVE